MAITTHIAVSVALSDAGEATRSLALARALRDRCPTGREVRITFVSNGSRFEPMIEQAGFPIVACQPRVKGNSIAEDLQWEFPHLVGSAELARSFIEGQLAIQRELRPDVVLHGMWPFANLAARMLGIPTELFTQIFAASRITGWTAHVVEQHDDNRLIRPTSDYTGPIEAPYVPIEDRVPAAV